MVSYRDNDLALYTVVLKSLKFPSRVDAVSGRWNRQGFPCVYATKSIANSLLEFSVHFGFRVVANDILLLQYSVPAAIVYDVQDHELPRDYRALQYDPSCQDLGSRLLTEQKAVVSFPSIFIPGERVFLINLQHADLNALRPLPYDLRWPW